MGVKGITWFDSSFGYKKKIEIDHTKVNGDETDFPVLVSVTDNDLRDEANSGHVKSSSGYDIIFSDSSEATLLKHEIERYVNTSGLLVFWVKINSLSSTSTTTFYIYYGKTGVVADPSSTDTWDSNFLAIWHFEDLTDSTSNGNTLTNHGADSGATGKVGRCYDFEQTNSDYMDEANICDLSAQTGITMEMWANMESTDGDRAGFVLGTDYHDKCCWLGYAQQFGRWDAEICKDSGNRRLWRSSASYPTNAWSYGTGTYTTTAAHMYVNGVIDEATNYDQGAFNWADLTDDSMQISKLDDLTQFADGCIDEARISSVVRSANWIKTTYNTQNAPAAFMSWGSEVTGSIKHTASDTINISDGITFKYKMNLSDTANISDDILFKHEYNPIDTITVSDDILLKHLLTITDAISVSDIMSSKRLLNLVDNITISDDILLKHLINLTDTLSIADAAILKHMISLSDSISVSDIIIYKHLLNLTDSINISDIVTFKRLLNLSDNVSITDNIVYKHLIALADNLGITDAAILKHFITLLDNMVIDDVIQAAHFISIYNHMDISDSITFKYSLFILDNISVLDDMLFDMLDICGNVFNIRSDTHSIYLPMPERGGEAGTLNNEIKLFDFWADERDTVNIGINSEPIVLSGTIYACTDDEDVEMTAIATKFLNIHDMMNKHKEVTITELGDCFDAVYIIKNFRYGTIRGNPYAYTWNLTLEYKRAI